MENAPQTNDGKYRILENKLEELRNEITELSDQGKFPVIGEKVNELKEKDSREDYEFKGFEFKDISNLIPEEADYHFELARLKESLKYVNSFSKENLNNNEIDKIDKLSELEREVYENYSKPTETEMGEILANAYDQVTNGAYTDERNLNHVSGAHMINTNTLVKLGTSRAIRSLFSQSVYVGDTLLRERTAEDLLREQGREPTEYLVSVLNQRVGGMNEMDRFPVSNAIWLAAGQNPYATMPNNPLFIFGHKNKESEQFMDSLWEIYKNYELRNNEAGISRILEYYKDAKSERYNLDKNVEEEKEIFSEEFGTPYILGDAEILPSNFLIPYLFSKNKSIQSKTRNLRGFVIRPGDIRSLRNYEGSPKDKKLYELSDYVIDLPNRAMLEKK